nr:hypothetical protein [Pedobacter kyonggii]
MKSKLKMPLRKLGVAVVLTSIAVAGCKKEEFKLESVSQTTKIADAEFSKLIQFISITTTVPKDQIVYDESSKEFIVYGWFHKNLEDIQFDYDRANEYKATYEK